MRSLVHKASGRYCSRGCIKSVTFFIEKVGKCCTVLSCILLACSVLWSVAFCSFGLYCVALLYSVGKWNGVELYFVALL